MIFFYRAGIEEARRTEHYNQALALFKRSIELADRNDAPDSPEWAQNSLLQSAFVYVQQGLDLMVKRPADAAIHAQEALHIAEELRKRNPLLAPDAFRQICSLQAELALFQGGMPTRNKAASARYLEEARHHALELAQLGSPWDAARLLAQSYRLEGNAKKALAIYNQTLIPQLALGGVPTFLDKSLVRLLISQVELFLDIETPAELRPDLDAVARDAEFAVRLALDSATKGHALGAAGLACLSAATPGVGKKTESVRRQLQEKGIGYLQEAVKLSPNHINSWTWHLVLAVQLRDRKQDKTAKDHARMALDNAPSEEDRKRIQRILDSFDR
jgi:tetratricopeptide (TPR) repeat protein